MLLLLISHIVINQNIFNKNIYVFNIRIFMYFMKKTLLSFIMNYYLIRLLHMKNSELFNEILNDSNFV